MSKLDAVEHLLSDARGQYIPRDFVECFNLADWGIDPESGAAQTCAAGCEAECVDWYWEAWDEILRKAEYKEGEYVWRLYQDGDLWALCDELMTDEEKQNFGFDEF